MLSRTNKDIVQQGIDADLLLDNPVFFEAVERVLNNYAQLEEDILTSEQSEVREIGARIKHYAMMRRCTLDIVRELNDIVLDGQNAAFENEEMEA